MTSATLGGGGVNKILTFADRGGRGGQSKSDILLTHADGGGGGVLPEAAATELYF